MAARSIGFQNEVIFRQPLLQAANRYSFSINSFITAYLNLLTGNLPIIISDKVGCCTGSFLSANSLSNCFCIPLDFLELYLSISVWSMYILKFLQI